MAWTLLSDRLLDPLLRFLGPIEAGCVGFTEVLVGRCGVTVPDPKAHRVYVRIEANGTVSGAVLQGATGVYHPVLGPGRQTVEAECVRGMQRATRRLNQIIGRSEDVQALEAAFRRVPEQWIDYHLMVQQASPPEVPRPRLPRGLVISRAIAADANRLFELQRKYELEEVLLAGSPFVGSAAMEHLRMTLDRQIVLMAELEGRAVAKANTNARGVFFDQIGGVFTEPRYRSRGVASALMARLLELIAADRKSATLYVKEHNAPAITMYRNLGFGVDGGFRVAYYG